MREDKESIITSMELFDPASADTIVEVPMGEQTLKFRVLRLDELTLQGIQATEAHMVRKVRDECIEAAEKGELVLPLLEVAYEIKDNLARLTRIELDTLWKSTWEQGKDKDDEEPNRGSWDDDKFRKDLYHMFIADSLAGIERVQMEGLLPSAMLDIGEVKDARTLTAEELTERVTDVIERETQTRRTLLRKLPEEALQKRFTYAAASQMAVVEARRRIRALILYAASRSFEKRNEPMFNISDAGFGSVESVLRDPSGAYDALLELFEGASAILSSVADQVVIEAGTITTDQADMLDRLGREPFLTSGGGDSQEEGRDSRLGGDELQEDSRPDDVVSEKGVVLVGREGEPETDNVDADSETS
jgi:hypothetical protein